MPRHPAFDRIEHRPWPLPQSEWRWRQSWCDLLFLHWPIPVAALRPLVPEPLTIQEYDGTSWIGVVPFRMEGVMLRHVPDLPWVSAFPELNVRLYVEYEGKPGVWFLSLDATNVVAVHAARRIFHLPYFKSAMSISMNRDGGFHYVSEREEAPAASFEATYQPRGEVYEAEPGTLEHWLTERYCLYAQNKKGILYRADVHHVPWPLQQAEAKILTSQMTSPFNLELEGDPALLHFTSRLDVVVWPLEVLAV